MYFICFVLYLKKRPYGLTLQSLNMLVMEKEYNKNSPLCVSSNKFFFKQICFQF